MRLNMLLPLLFLLQSPLHSQNIVINEIMAANDGRFMDEDGDYPDWIELYNRSTTAANLQGWFLSDDPDNLLRWQLPPIYLGGQSHLLLFASGKDRRPQFSRAAAPHWETIIREGDRWRYLVPQAQPSAFWTYFRFDDSQWAEGASGFGYGDNDDATIITQKISILLRHRFRIENLHDVLSAFLHIDYDDAFVAYLNGEEVARRNIGAPGEFVGFDQKAETPSEASMFRGLAPPLVAADLKSHLQAGDNVLAIEVHNTDTGSSDMSLIPFLTLGMRVKPAESRGFVEALSNAFSGELHTNFKIKQSGEGLFLSDSMGVISDSLAACLVPSGLSFGRKTDGGAQWVYFSDPTPGSSNDSSPPFAGYADSLICSHPAGFYDAPMQVSLQTETATAPIYFTTNGDLPDSDDSLYTHPLQIDSTIVLRARAIAPGKLPGKVMTRTFFIAEYFRLPVLSLSLAPADLWDEQTGIYAEGPNASPEYPFFGANYWQDWEKTAHLEFFELDNQHGDRAIDQDIGLKIFAGYSRAWPQKAFSLHARRKYGKSTIEHRIFPAREIDSFKSFVLRNSGSDWAMTMLRDAMMQQLIADYTDLDYQEVRPAIVFLNGEYWGIYNLREKLNEDYLAAHHGVDPQNVDILEGPGAWVVEGDDRHYRDLLTLLENNDLTDPGVYQRVGELMDIKNYIDYQAAEIYYANTDWPGNNIKFWRPKTSDGRWRWLLFDTDFGFGLFHNSQADANMLEFVTATDGPIWPNPPRSTWLFRRLLESERFRNRFISRLSSHLNITFVPERVQNKISQMKSVIEPDMARNILRWKDEPAVFNRSYESFGAWSNRVEALKNFASRRPAYVRQHLRDKFQLSGTFRLQIEIEPANSGQVFVAGVPVPRRGWQGVYFDSIPLDLRAASVPGFRFAGWFGADTSRAEKRTLVADRNHKFIARFEPVVSSPVPVVINEINFLPQTQNSPADWIELANPSDTAVDLSGWRLQDSDDSHIFVLPQDTGLPAAGFLVLCRDTSAFTQALPEVKNRIGNLGFGFKSTGELVRLFDAGGHLVDSLRFAVGAPWPDISPGYTLALQRPDLDNSRPESWTVAVSLGGTPGAANNSGAVTSNLENQVLPDAVDLAQNFPNPFKSRTQIRFKLAQDAYVNVEIFDLQGRKVAALAKGKMQAGAYSVRWQPGASQASGIYFCRLRAGSHYTITRRMLYLK